MQSLNKKNVFQEPLFQNNVVFLLQWYESVILGFKSRLDEFCFNIAAFFKAQILWFSLLNGNGSVSFTRSKLKIDAMIFMLFLKKNFFEKSVKCYFLILKVLYRSSL